MRYLRLALFWSLTAYSQRVVAELGSYSGSLGVGTVDVELNVEPSVTFSPEIILLNGSNSSSNNNNNSSSSTPAFKLDTVYFTLFYPTTRSTVSTSPQHPWLPAPADLIAQGLALAAGSSSVTPSLIQTGFQLYAGNLNIPAAVDVPLASNSTAKLPVLVFSHGDPTMAQWSSQLFGELASRGIVVAAVTHRDGSAPATQVRFENGTAQYDRVAFTNAQVSGNLSSDEFHARQTEMRVAEVRAVVDVLRDINSGKGGSIAQRNSRKEGGNTLGGWQHKLDLDQGLVVAGHSFGGNTVFSYLAQQSGGGGGVAYDPGKSSGNYPANISSVAGPLLIADSEEWSGVASDFYGQKHFDTLKGIAHSIDNNGGQSAWFMTLLGTVHSSLTDVGLIAASFASFFTNETQLLTLDARAAIVQYANVTADFITYVQQRGAYRGVLNEAATFPTYQQNGTNASALQSPWEVHVAPKNATGKKSAGERLGSPLSLLTLLLCIALGFAVVAL